MRVVNLWAGPGAGKSTMAAGLFYLSKVHGVRCELVTEYAKDLTYEAAKADLADGFRVLVPQEKRLARLVGQVDMAITDGPLPLVRAYHEDASSALVLRSTVAHLFDRYDNFNVKVIRTHPYQAYGRKNLTEEAAREKDACIDRIAADYGGYDFVVPSNEHGLARLHAYLQSLRFTDTTI